MPGDASSISGSITNFWVICKLLSTVIPVSSLFSDFSPTCIAGRFKSTVHCWLDKNSILSMACLLIRFTTKTSQVLKSCRVSYIGVMEALLIHRKAVAGRQVSLCKSQCLLNTSSDLSNTCLSIKLRGPLVSIRNSTGCLSTFPWRKSHGLVLPL